MHESYNLKHEFNEIYNNTILPKIYKIKEILDNKNDKNEEHIKRIEEVYAPYTKDSEKTIHQGEVIKNHYD
jgi:hypothetical protein